ncbi:AAA family ATPase [Cellulosimicrobium sp. 4261]|uniref:ATP-dependent nuclease n=1 Tax=Cellulosimicrobium sp. 4261 TaxID=3156458 RepID=UPI0033949805
MTDPAQPAPAVYLTSGDVFADGGDQPYLEVQEWPAPVSLFVGRNGSGKSKTAMALSQGDRRRVLSSDRLAGIQHFDNYYDVSYPGRTRGLSISPDSMTNIRDYTAKFGVGADELYLLHDRPDLALRVASFIATTLGREVEVERFADGYLDPVVRVGSLEYSLLRDEGHGLRELVILLAATYRDDWDLLVVDEPELHLHSALTRLWYAELVKECQTTNRHAIVVTHEASLVQPTSRNDLHAIWHFAHGRAPMNLGEQVKVEHRDEAIAHSLRANPSLVSDLLFSPRPVLVEGALDHLALKIAIARTQEHSSAVQTDVVQCGTNNVVPVWLDLCWALGLDARAVYDLDSIFEQRVQRSMDRHEAVRNGYRKTLIAAPPTTAEVIRPLIQAANKHPVPANPKERAAWLAALTDDDDEQGGLVERRDQLLRLWKEQGVWVHPQGNLEHVLGLSPEDKGREATTAAANESGPLDAVADWVAYQLDTRSSTFELLSAAVREWATWIQLQVQKDDAFRLSGTRPPTGDRPLLRVEHLGPGRHRITVTGLDDFNGYWMDFTPELAVAAMGLQPPVKPAD